MFSWWRFWRTGRAEMAPAARPAGWQTVLEVERLEGRLTPSDLTGGDNGHVYGRLDAPSDPGFYFEARRPGSKKWLVEGPFLEGLDLIHAEKRLMHKGYAIRNETLYIPDPGPLDLSQLLPPFPDIPLPAPAPPITAWGVQVLQVGPSGPHWQEFEMYTSLQAAQSQVSYLNAVSPPYFDPYYGYIAPYRLDPSNPLQVSGDLYHVSGDQVLPG
jgi:hypothetical protein